MADARGYESFFEKLDRVAVWLSHLYFLRFPLLTAVAMAGLPWLGLCTRLSELLASLFVSDKWGVFLVSFVAFTTAWAILVTGQLIWLYADERFSRNNAATAGEAPKPLPKFSITLLQAVLVAAVAALPVTIAIVYKTATESQTGWGTAVLWAALGLAGSLALFFFAVAAQLVVNSDDRAQELAREVFIVSWLPASAVRWIAQADPMKMPRRMLRSLLKPVLGKGFFDESAPSSGGGRFLPGHGFASFFFAVSFVVFVLVGQLSPRWMLKMPALFFVVLLLMLLCWGLSALSFLLDRYRVPVLTIILVFLYAFSPDYYYGVRSEKTLQPLTPQEVIAAGSVSKNRIIVVATEGGGIQASAWTARVLTGLQQMFPEFSRSVRLISSVSGGSTGALFFVNGYNQETGVPDDEALELITEMAAENSLDYVANSLVYHDFFHTLIPFWELGDDRGTALELAWAKNCQKVCEKFTDEKKRPCPIKNCEMAGTLAEWAELVKAGKLPANIFNGTVVENGDRLLLSNSDVGKDRERGRLNFAQQLSGKDIQALTAARLSATFPYVSPAARTELTNTVGALQHVVDGGYYDNYGMTSLVEWLDKALGDNQLSNVLVIQIQSFKAGKETPPNAAPPKSDTGYISQLLAPLVTLLKIRTSAQASHKELEFALLKSKWPGRVDGTAFRFNCFDAPLTWKLTAKEKQHVLECWKQDYTNQSDPKNPSNVVKQFLEGMKASGGQTSNGQP